MRRFLISAANLGPNLFHQARTVSGLISTPRSWSKSSTSRSESGNGVEDLDAAAFMTRAAVGINGFMARQWHRVRGDGLGFGQQAGLVSLELNEEMTVCLTGGEKGFFDSAWRRA